MKYQFATETRFSKNNKNKKKKRTFVDELADSVTKQCVSAGGKKTTFASNNEITQRKNTFAFERCPFGTMWHHVISIMQSGLSTSICPLLSN